MVSAARFWTVWLAGLLLWVVALVLASPHDLALARAAFAPDSVQAWAVYYLAELPSYALLVISIVSLVGERRGWRRGISRPSALRASPRRTLAMTIVALALSGPVAITWTLKLLWGRVRFVDLAPGRGYTPFHVPAGPCRGQSFPSGHVAMSLLWVPVPHYLWATGRRCSAVAAGAIVLGHGVLVVWGRMAAGHHYLTDGLFSAGMMMLLGPLLLRSSLRRRGSA
jgi:membrane-associated phospholipid phosphatase